MVHESWTHKQLEIKPKEMHAAIFCPDLSSSLTVTSAPETSLNVTQSWLTMMSAFHGLCYFSVISILLVNQLYLVLWLFVIATFDYFKTIGLDLNHVRGQ